MIIREEREWNGKQRKVNSLKFLWKVEEEDMCPCSRNIQYLEIRARGSMKKREEEVETGVRALS